MGSSTDRSPLGADRSELEPRGSCFGFDIYSDLPFYYLRDRGGQPLEIREVEKDDLPPPGDELQRWGEVPGKRAQITISEAPGGTFRIRLAGTHDYWFDPSAGLLAMAPSKDPALRELFLWSTPAALALTHRGDLGLHAAAVEIGGRALILTAASGSGKSTTAAAFHVAGHRVLSEDLTCIRLDGKNGPFVMPGPAVLRVSEEARDRLELAELKQNYSRHTKLHLELPAARRGSGEPVPLAGLAFLDVGDEAFSCEPVETTEALARLWPLTFVLAGEAGRAACFHRLIDMINSVPMWQVSRRLDWEELFPVVERIVSGLLE